MLSKNGRDFNQVVSSGYKTKSIAISETLSTVNLFFLLLGKRRSRQHLPEKKILTIHVFLFLKLKW